MIASTVQLSRSAARFDEIHEHELADVEHLGVHHLAAAEHQQLARERRGALGGAADLLDVLAHG